MDKWKNAVIHLECATDSEHFYDRLKRIERLREELDKEEITHEQFAEEITGKSVLIAHNGRRYFITARHVLWDEHSARREYEEEEARRREQPFLLQYAKERALNNIFNIIFRVPSLDEVPQGHPEKGRALLMNLGAGTWARSPYTFSTPDLDLAIVSLDQRDSSFADELSSKGYEPISLNDIAEAPSKEGAPVYTVGFPSSTSLIGQIRQRPAEAHWSSSYFSLPTFSFGHVSMLHEDLPFYWVDMSIYPGNSGGPVIEEDRLVGIVSGQPTIPVENTEQLQTRIPFGKIIKAKHIIELLSKQEQKDETPHNKPI